MQPIVNISYIIIEHMLAIIHTTTLTCHRGCFWSLCLCQASLQRLILVKNKILETSCITKKYCAKQSFNKMNLQKKWIMWSPFAWTKHIYKKVILQRLDIWFAQNNKKTVIKKWVCKKNMSLQNWIFAKSLCLTKAYL